MYIGNCKLCGGNTVPTPSHLKHKHNMTKLQYTEQTGCSTWGSDDKSLNKLMDIDEAIKFFQCKRKIQT